MIAWNHSVVVQQVRLRVGGWRFVLAGSLAVIAAGSPLHAAPKTVQVDCSRKTLADALVDESVPLVVEFWGICHEDVLIARDDVTLRGIVPPPLPPGGSQHAARVVGAPGPLPTPRPGVWIDGGRRVTLESFAVEDSDSQGVRLTRGAEVVIRSVVTDGSERGGLMVIGSSRALVRDSSFDSSDLSHGIQVWENSSLTVGGSISAEGNAVVGILASDNSAITQDFGGAQIAANENGHSGIALQVGAHLLVSSTSVDANDNALFGAFLYFDAGYFGLLSATGNEAGLWLEASTIEITNADIENNGSVDVSLDFGSRASFLGGSTSVGSVDCGAGVLTRGAVSCPAPLQAQSTATTRRARGAGGSSLASVEIAVSMRRSHAFVLDP